MDPGADRNFGGLCITYRAELSGGQLRGPGAAAPIAPLMRPCIQRI